MNNPIDDSVLRRIKKCLALSASSEPHEAAAALRQAQKLMEAHGVTQTDLVKQEIGTGEVKSKTSVSRIKDWELRLLSLVSKAFGCKLLWMSSNSYNQDMFGRYILIGLKSQVELAKYTATVMQRKLMKARAEFLLTLRPSMPRAGKTIEGDSFAHGWVDTVSRTIHDFAHTPEHQAQIDQHFESLRGHGTAKTRKTVEFGELGYNQGRDVGAGESLHNPVSEQKNLYLE